MNDTPTAKRRFLTDAESFKAYGLLDTHLRPSSTPGEFAYADGYSDAKIAEAVGCTLNNIVGLRERAFGRLAKMPEIARDPRIEHLIAAHDAFVTDVCAAISELNPGAKMDPGPYLLSDAPMPK